MSALSAGLWVLDAAVLLGADARWLRVAQREHYEPGRVAVLVRTWMASSPLNRTVPAVAAPLLVLGLFLSPWASLAGVLVLGPWPWRLTPWPTSGKVAFTPRFRRLVVLTVVMEGLLVAGTRSARGGAVVVLLAPLMVDVALALLRPVEKRLGRKYVVEAQRKLEKVRPRIVAITGSYGKTSTKLYTHQLLSGSLATVASPASFNNLMGLSRTVNDSLPQGTEVFVAEMGTYGPGEIRKLCEVFPPDVAAIVTIGEAHLERMRDRATIVAAKSEITETAKVVVLNVDVPELADLAKSLPRSKTVVRVSTRVKAAADAAVVAEGGRWRVVVKGKEIADVAIPDTGHPVNLAVAVGITLGLKLTPEAVARAVGHLPAPPHRAEVSRTEAGVVVIDDTYNANPDGARQAVDAARALAAAGGRIWVVTPGMVELGVEQAARNATFAGQATAEARMTLVVTGRTNRSALVSGAAGPGAVRTMPNRQVAARTVMAEARAGDVVLYENDLPDHYP